MLRNGFFNLAGSMIRLGLAVVMIPLLIHLIGVDEYGLWTLVNAALSMAALAEGGLSISTTYFLSADLAADDNVAISKIKSRGKNPSVPKRKDGTVAGPVDRLEMFVTFGPPTDRPSDEADREISCPSNEAGFEALAAGE